LHGKAHRNYKATPYNGQAIIFKAAKKTWGKYSDPLLGWDKLVNGGLEVNEVPGLHANIISEPWVRALAEKINISLKKLNL
jgi:thioesterase domain-containing protein